MSDKKVKNRDNTEIDSGITDSIAAAIESWEMLGEEEIVNVEIFTNTLIEVQTDKGMYTVKISKS